MHLYWSAGALHSFSLWLPADKGHVSSPLHSWCLWLNLLHLKHLFATRWSSTLQISQPIFFLFLFCCCSLSLSFIYLFIFFFLWSFFLVSEPASITILTCPRFVLNLNLAAMSPVTKPSSGFWASIVSSRSSTVMSCVMLCIISLGFHSFGALTSSSSPSSSPHLLLIVCRVNLFHLSFPLQ
jgi:hypothetical protein